MKKYKKHSERQMNKCEKNDRQENRMCYNVDTKDEARASEGKEAKLMMALMLRLKMEEQLINVLRSIKEQSESSREQEVQEVQAIRYDKENNLLVIPKSVLTYIKDHEGAMEELLDIINSIEDCKILMT